MVSLKFGFVKQLTVWTCGINYGQKTTNVVELKYQQHFPDPWKLDRTSESKKWCGNWYGCNQAIGDGGHPLDSAHATQTVSTKIMSLKNKRAAAERRITNTLKELDSTIEQYGRKAIIRGYVNNL